MEVIEIRSNTHPFEPFETELLALLIRDGKHPGTGVEFVTDPEDMLQVGFFSRPGSYEVAPHAHRAEQRRVDHTNEVLVIQEGFLKATFFDSLGNECGSWTVEKGDVLILLSGGHGFKIEEGGCKFIEVKQGPYLGASDKVPIG